MNYGLLPSFNIGDLKIDKPIIQGGMGVGISLSGLASAVADAGGIGVISSVGLGMIDPVEGAKFREANRQQLIEEIRKARKKTDGIIGVNIMVALTDYNDMVISSIDEGVDILFLGAGLPLKFPEGFTAEMVRSCNTKFVPIVSSARAAKIILRHWEKSYKRLPDGLVVEGPKAGGHLGFKPEQIFDPDFSLEEILPQVVETAESFSADLPVIAAGGIYTGADIHKFLNLGAKAVQMGTRFVATHECDASLAFKEAYINCKEDDIKIIQSPVGLPGRAISNKFLTDVSNGGKTPFQCPWKCLKTCDFREAPYCIAKALLEAQHGMLENGFAFAGSNAYRVKEIISVKELFQDLENEYEAVLADIPKAQAV